MQIRTIATPRVRAALPMLLALAITAYGGVLRLYALSSRYGPIDHPAWARVVTRDFAPLARHLEPGMYAWPPVASPYVGGDPINYLRFAREMKSFYQAHVREPIFLVVTRFFLWLVDGQDVGISFASATTSTLTIFATFLLGAAAFSPAVGLFAAFGIAIDYQAISWAPDGWRDDTFTLAVILATWALIRLRQRPSPSRAIVFGVLGAIACLTRITSLSWLIPATLYFTFIPFGTIRRRRLAAAIAASLTVILIAPFLINCWRATGDPFFSINAHTVYYRAGEGLPYDKPQSSVSYLEGKIARRPIGQLDTALTGIFVLPIANKWSGFGLWIPHLNSVLEGLSIAGLLLFVAHPIGRLLLVVIFASLVPYALTWNVGGGAEWRFTMHVYPLLLLASAYTLRCLARAASAIWIVERRGALFNRRTIGPVLAATAILGVAAVVYERLPYDVASEAVGHGDETTIAAGERDGVFFTDGWSPSRREGAVVARVTVHDRARISLPLPRQRPYRLTVRVDPVTADAPKTMTLLLNDHLIARQHLGLDPQRVGSYSVDVPAEFVRSGNVVLQFVADSMIRAGEAGPRYTWLPPDAPIALRVWYVRIHPL